MKKRHARAGLLVALVAILLAGCGWFGADEGSLVVDIADLPDGITKIVVTVTGEGMEPISGEFTGDPAGSEPLIIPEGTGRQWTVIVDVDNDTPVTQYTAEGTADIVAGEIAEVTASLSISGTKLVVIDDWNGRIVQVDDIGGSGWTEFDSSSIDIGASDLEIGPNGKIYVAAGNAGIVVLDTIADTTPAFLPGLAEMSPAQIGIDHANELIYFWDSNLDYGLYSVPLAGGTPTDYSDVVFPYLDPQGEVTAVIKGVTVNDSGIAAIVYARDSDLRSLILDPAGSGSVADDEMIYAGGEGWGVTNEKADIVAKDDGFYVVFLRDDNTGPVVQLDSALVVQDSYGSLYDGEISTSDTLYGPALFVGHRNPQIQFIDDNPDPSGVDQLVEIEDILGTGRTNFGETGSGVGQFEFFEPIPQ